MNYVHLMFVQKMLIITLYFAI